MDKKKEILVKFLKDPDESIRTIAAESLEKVETRERLDGIEKTIQGGNKLAKLRAVYALIGLKGQKVILLLLNAIKDPIEDVRAAAIRVLGKTGDARVMAPLVDCLSDNSDIIKRTAVEALGEFRDPRLTDSIMMMLKSQDTGVVEKAIEALGKIGDKKAEAALIHFATNGSGNIKINAIKAIGELEL